MCSQGTAHMLTELDFLEFVCMYVSMRMCLGVSVYVWVCIGRRVTFMFPEKFCSVSYPLSVKFVIQSTGLAGLIHIS